MTPALEFENQVVGHLVAAGQLVIRQHSPARNVLGFMGRRKPDLLSIGPTLQITVWELKSASECSGIENEARNHMWFRHPQSEYDYISSVRTSFADNRQLSAPIAAWCIVLKGELAYWLNPPLSWRHPLVGQATNALQAGLAAPVAQAQNIQDALHNLSWNSWAVESTDTVTYHTGVIPHQVQGEE